MDASDLIDGVYFIDERCEELEEIFRKDPKYEDCKVRHQHIGDGEFELDPFVIRNSEGERLVTLETWEVDALSDLELLSYTDVQISREQNDYSGSALAFIIIVILLGPTAAVLSLMAIFSLLGSLAPLVSTIVGALDLIILLSGIIFYRKRKGLASAKRDIDLVAARENSTFLFALRKLASLSDVSNWKQKEYTERLKCIEVGLSGFDS